MADPAGLARSANAAKARWVNTVVRYPVHFGARDSCEVRVRDWVYPSIPIPGRPGSRSRSAAAAAEGLGEDQSTKCICEVWVRRRREAALALPVLPQTSPQKLASEKNNILGHILFASGASGRAQRGLGEPRSGEPARACSMQKLARVSLAKIETEAVREAHNRASVSQYPKLRIFRTAKIKKQKQRMSKTLGTVQARRRAARGDSSIRYDSQAKANRWVVTLNFGGEEDMERMSAENTASLRRLNAAAQVPPTTYAVFQPEQGETGTLHIQGYFEFEKRLTLAQVKKHLGARCHLEPAEGTQSQCIEYCKKETDLDADPPVYGRIEGGEIVEFGTPMKLNSQGRTNGSRTDWADVFKMTREGATTLAIMEKHPAMMPHTRAIQSARFALQCERSREETTKLLVLWGAPDTGKTTTAIALCEPGKYFVLTADGKGVWWDGYDPDRHETIILDEFVGSRMPITFLNQLCDKIDINVQTKGGFSRFLAKRLIITSNFSPREWYSACAESRQDALWRRIATEVEFQLVDQIDNMRGDASRTSKRLHLEVHKGHWCWRMTKSRYPFDDCCALAAKVEQEKPQLDDSMGSEDEVELRKSMRVLAPDSQSEQLHGSQDDPIEISEEIEESDADPGDFDDYDEWAAAQARRGRFVLSAVDEELSEEF